MCHENIDYIFIIIIFETYFFIIINEKESKKEKDLNRLNDS